MENLCVSGNTIQLFIHNYPIMIRDGASLFVSVTSHQVIPKHFRWTFVVLTNFMDFFLKTVEYSECLFINRLYIMWNIKNKSK